jgi:hypothetical protein
MAGAAKGGAAKGVLLAPLARAPARSCLFCLIARRDARGGRSDGSDVEEEAGCRQGVKGRCGILLEDVGFRRATLACPCASPACSVIGTCEGGAYARLVREAATEWPALRTIDLIRTCEKIGRKSDGMVDRGERFQRVHMAQTHTSGGGWRRISKRPLVACAQFLIGPPARASCTEEFAKLYHQRARNAFGPRVPTGVTAADA